MQLPIFCPSFLSTWCEKRKIHDPYPFLWRKKTAFLDSQKHVLNMGFSNVHKFKKRLLRWPWNWLHSGYSVFTDQWKAKGSKSNQKSKSEFRTLFLYLFIPSLKWEAFLGLNFFLTFWSVCIFVSFVFLPFVFSLLCFVFLGRMDLFPSPPHPHWGTCE